MYDLANQSFQLLINTLLFSIYIQQVVVGQAEKGEKTWAMMVASQTALVVLLSPILGALADARQWKRELLLGTGVFCSALTIALAVVGPGQLWLAALIYIPAAVACGLGESFLASFLPQISTERNVGFVSALGWTMSYVGALFLLGIVALYTWGLGYEQPSEMPPMFVVAGVWFFLGIIPAAIYLRERPVAALSGAPSGAWRRLARSVRETRRFAQLARFLVIFYVYTISVQAMIQFLGLIAIGSGFSLKRSVIFALVIATASGIGALTTATVQDRLGHRRTIQVFLALWLAGAIGLIAARSAGSDSPLFWAVSAFIGLGLGGIGTASRALVGLFTPADRAAEFFGVWGMTTKLAAITGAVVVLAVGIDVGLYVLAACFAAGIGLMFTVNERAGAAAARSVQSVHGGPD